MTSAIISGWDSVLGVIAPLLQHKTFERGSGYKNDVAATNDAKSNTGFTILVFDHANMLGSY